MTKPHELRALTPVELKEKVASLEKVLFELRSKATTDKVEKPDSFRKARKEIARCLTILKEKENSL